MTQQLLLGDFGINPRDSWETPQALFDEINREGNFTIDACCAHSNAKLARHWTLGDDGLLQSWAGERVWCNPPYSQILPWVEKAHKAALACLLVPVLCDQPWWHVALASARLIDFFKGRIRFRPPAGVKETSPNGRHALIWFGDTYQIDCENYWRSRDATTGRILPYE